MLKKLRHYSPASEQDGSMPISLSVKNAPDHLVEALRARAERNHRSLNGELLSIIEAALEDSRPLTPAEFLAQMRRRGASSPGESVAMIRADRDSR